MRSIRRVYAPQAKRRISLRIPGSSVASGFFRMSLSTVHGVRLGTLSLNWFLHVCPNLIRSQGTYHFFAQNQSFYPSAENLPGTFREPSAEPSAKTFRGTFRKNLPRNPPQQKKSITILTQKKPSAEPSSKTFRKNLPQNLATCRE